MSPVTDFLAATQQAITRYGFPVFIFFGNIGNLLLIAIFCRRHQRQNSCSLYLLVAAVCSLVGVNWGFGTNMYALYQPPDPFSKSLLLCRVRGYILQASSLLYKVMILFACIDRFAVTSTRATVRQFVERTMALKITGIVTVFCMLISIHLPIFETIENNRCSFFGTYGLFFSIYLVCIFGLILPVLTVVFSCFIIKNLKMIRTRVQPLSGTNNGPHTVLNRRDMTFIKLTLAEVVIGICLTSLFPINSLYGILTSNVPNKSPDRIAIESFMSFLGLLVLFYLNYCSTFYLYVAISKPFRNEVLQLILKCFKRPERQHTNATFNLASMRQRAEYV